MSYKEEQEEENEEFVVVPTHAIVQPYAMMVHSLDAALALGAVSDSDVFDILALLTVLDFIHKEPVFK